MPNLILFFISVAVGFAGFFGLNEFIAPPILGASTFIVQQGGTGQNTFTSSKLLYGAGTNPIQSVATTSVSCSGSTSCTSFTAIGSSPISISSSGASSTILGDSNTFSGVLNTFSNTIKVAALSGLVGANTGNLYSFASSSLFGFTPANSATTLTIAGTSNQITSSAGAQDLSTNRTWTLSIPQAFQFPLAFTSTYGTTTYASSTILSVSGTGYIVTASTTALTVGNSPNCSGSSALTTNSSGVVACGAIVASGGSWPFTPATWWSQAVQSTSTALQLTGAPYSLFASSTAIFSALNTTYATSTFASSTAISTNNFLSVNGTSTAFAITNIGSSQLHYAGSLGNTLGVATGTITANSPITLDNSTRSAIGGALAISCSSCSTFAYPFTAANFNAVAVNSTSTPIWNTITTSPGFIATSSLINFASSTSMTTTLGTWLATTGGSVGIGTTSPWAQLSVNVNGNTLPSFIIGSTTKQYFGIGTGGSIILSGQENSTTSPATLDWANSGPLVEYQMGTGALTINPINATTSLYWGSKKVIGFCNSGSTAGTVTINGVQGIGGYTQTTTANKCDYIGLMVVAATSTVTAGVPASWKLIYTGAQTGI